MKTLVSRQSESRRGSALKWIIPLLILGAAGYVGYVYKTTDTINPNAEQTAPVAKPKDLKIAGMPGKADPNAPVIPQGKQKAASEETEGDAGPLAGIEGLDAELGGKVAGLLKQAEATLVGIKDEDGAKSAVTTFGEMTESLGGLFDQLKDADEGVITAISEYITTTALPNLNNALSRAKGVEGAWAVLEPVVKAWTDKLEGFGK